MSVHDGRIRVGVVAPYYPPKLGGVEAYAEKVALAYRREDDLVPIVITAHEGSRRTATSVQDGISVIRLGMWFKLSNTPVSAAWLFGVRRVLDRCGIDVVHAHAPVPGLADIAIRAAGKRPVIFTYHAGTMRTGHYPGDAVVGVYEKRVLPRSFARATKVVTVSQTALGHDVPGSEMITPGVQTGVFTPGPDVRSSTVLYVGRIERTSAWKGVDVLLHAFRQIAAERPDARLRLVGGGDAVRDFEKLATELGIGHRVEFSGPLSGRTLVEAYQNASVLVLPSLTAAESFGMTLIEAMACATPVVGSDVGGIPYVIEHGENGLLVPPGDPRALAEVCELLLADDASARRMGAIGRRTAERDFDWDAKTRRYVEIVRKLAVS